MKKFFVIICSAMLVFSLVGTASALMTYTDSTLWEAAAGAFIEEDFESYKADEHILNRGPVGPGDPGPFTTTPSGFMFQELGTDTSANVINVRTDPTVSYSDTARRAPNDTNYLRALARDDNDSNPGSTRLRIFFDSPTYAFAADFGDISVGGIELRADNFDPNGTCCGNLFDVPVEVSSGFFGFVSDVAFTSILFQTTNYDPRDNDTAGAGFGLDNVRASVPEPTTLLLLGTGLIGFAVASRRKFFK
jgi:hypothetical protein